MAGALNLMRATTHGFIGTLNGSIIRRKDGVFCSIPSILHFRQTGEIRVPFKGGEIVIEGTK